ncbi:hypothetical protein L207DRAFT_578495 [Hyaloscypha variabilis F]|uniref:Uncharacterized protein n=1 Tax=Hyaloscypha variabilis (strain UAMH 11265 / GT02V1 / F) TaxID=1149755 RepID=A0A2J6S499_HYAVF|nr:hypothetical protein L207DRAFT_578495 [Hyaloscypha variabilis F]
MKFLISTIFAAIIAAMAASAAPSYSNMSVTELQFSLKELVQPLDIVHIGDDGVLRVFNTVDFTVQHAVPLTAEQATEFAGNVDDTTSAPFVNVNGYNVPSTQLLSPPEPIVTKLKNAIASTKAEMANLSQPAPAGELAGRPTLPCNSYLCVFTATCINNCCLYCVVASGSLGKCIAPYC